MSNIPVKFGILDSAFPPSYPPVFRDRLPIVRTGAYWRKRIRVDGARGRPAVSIGPDRSLIEGSRGAESAVKSQTRWSNTMKAAATALLMFILANAEVLASPGSSCAPAFIEIEIEAWYEELPRSWREEGGREPHPPGFKDIGSPDGQEFESGRYVQSTRLIPAFYRGSKIVDGERVPGTFIHILRRDDTYSHYWVGITSPTYDELVTMLTCRVLPRSENPNWIIAADPVDDEGGGGGGGGGR